MALLICGGCQAIYAPARKCPHCGARDEVARFDWEEEGMPKATVEGGASAGVPAAEEPVVATPARAPKTRRPAPPPPPAEADATTE